VGRQQLEQSREHLDAQLLGRGLLAGPRDDLGQGRRDQRLVPTDLAVLEVLADLGVLGVAHFVAQVFLQVTARLFTAAVTHFLLSDRAPAIPRSAA
jgi:hypothetical protein